MIEQLAQYRAVHVNRPTIYSLGSNTIATADVRLMYQYFLSVKCHVELPIVS